MGSTKQKIEKLEEKCDELSTALRELGRLIYRDSKWRPLLIAGMPVYSGKNEYGGCLLCNNCNHYEDIYVKTGIDIKSVMGEVKCSVCGLIDWKIPSRE